MPCDICSTSPAAHIVTARNMRKAVRHGFNPFHLGLVTPTLLKLASTDSPDLWKQQATTGLLASSDWALCPACMPHLTPYLRAGFASRIIAWLRGRDAAKGEPHLS